MHAGKHLLSACKCVISGVYLIGCTWICGAVQYSCHTRHTPHEQICHEFTLVSRQTHKTCHTSRAHILSTACGTLEMHDTYISSS